MASSYPHWRTVRPRSFQAGLGFDLALRRALRILHYPAARIWREITLNRRLAAWLADGKEVTRRDRRMAIRLRLGVPD